MGRILIPQLGQSDAGYFRIGNLVLNIPPEHIQCHKVINNQEVMPLRFPFAMPVKTGQARWDVTWTWKAIYDDSQSDPWASWRSVQQLLAIFKSSPFVEVFNDHIRQIVNPGDLTSTSSKDDVMAFALRQMRVDTMPDLSDTLQVTINMSFFNYKPYSKDFKYNDGTGKKTTAVNSPLYNSYIASWINANLNYDPTQEDGNGAPVSSTDWVDQNPGTLTLSWREYQAVELKPPPLPNTNPNNPSNVPNPSVTQPGASQGTQSNYFNNVFVNPIAPSNPAIGWWVQAVAIPESNGNYNAWNKNTKTNSGAPSVAYGLLQWTRDAAIDAMKQSDKSLGTNYIDTATQGGYLKRQSTASSGLVWTKKTVSNPQSTDAIIANYISWMSNPPVTGGAIQLQNDMGKGWAIYELIRANGSVLTSWQAHLGGTASNPANNSWFSKAVNSWRGNSGNPQAFAATITTTPAQPTSSVPTVATSGTNSNTQNSSSAGGGNAPENTVPLNPSIITLLNNGWTYDYFTEVAAFLYKDHNLVMADQEHGDSPSSTDIADIDADHFIYPTQISVIFMNNIAQIPMASYQYPVYQHLGPVSTLVSIGLLSNADIDGAGDSYSEPQHTGLSLISGMTNMLENQFQVLRNEWRRVSSVHRMQSIAVKNQVLNLLGIHGVLTKEITTETVPESPNLVSAQFNAVQYENVFETVDPFQVQIVPGQISQQIIDMFYNGIFNQYAGQGQYTAVTNLSNLMQNPHSVDATALLLQWLTKANPAPDPTAYIVPTPISFTGDQQSLMLKCLTEGSAVNTGNATGELGITGTTNSFAIMYPDIYNQIKVHSQLNYSDFFLITNGTPAEATDYDALQNMAKTINASIQTALAANPSFVDPIKQLFNIYLQYAITNNVALINTQLLQLESTPAISSSLSTITGNSTPGALSVNEDHGCYSDLGIKNLQFGGMDYTPAVYFYDDNADLKTYLNNQAGTVVQNTINAAVALGNGTPIANKRMSFSGNSFSPNDLQAILSTVQPSAYTMAKAFPTFKLFLMEDHSDKPFYAYDSFYSYASVIDMEIIRYRDKPDTAVIQISDLMHLLDQKIYDTTPQGSFERELQTPWTKNLSGNQAITGASGYQGGVQITTTPGGFIADLSNQFSEINNHDPGHTLFPLKFFPLQTGTKIQVRMGFSNNPDLLTPVFTGQVTQMEGDEILTITAQSYMLELMTVPIDDIQRDGFKVDGFFNKEVIDIAAAIRDTAQGNLLYAAGALGNLFNPNSPAYSGGAQIDGISIPGILTTSGDTLNIMAAMIRSSTSTHFGHWQYGAPTDPYLKGYTWQSAIGSVLNFFSSSPLTKGATGLEAGYDRSFENILTSHAFGPNGTAIANPSGNARAWWFEKTAGFGPAFYHVPKDTSFTPWNLIQDVARRYPEFIVAVKQYGFPYTADATLVFANPHDFYSTRAAMPGEIAAQQTAASNTSQFNTWWTSGTNSGRVQFVAFCTGIGSQWLQTTLVNYDKQNNITTDSTGLYIGPILGGFGETNTMGNQLAAHIDTGGPTTFFAITNLYEQVIGSWQSNLVTTSRVQAQSALEQIITAYLNYSQQMTTGSTAVALDARMKPVRQWHLINQDNIVHNGIVMNDKFYNAVRILDNTIKVNAGIPNQYCRVLNVDPLMIDVDNVKGSKPFTNAYAQSFLRDELAKVYRGELVLTGMPEIEPYDVLVMLDPSTGISGPIEVDSVIHSFNLENGYITIVKPRGFVMVNDSLSAPIFTSIWGMLTDITSQVEGYAGKLGINHTEQVAATLALQAGLVLGAVSAPVWVSGLAALGAYTTLMWVGTENQLLNPMGIAPLVRYSRPWVGGLEGWKTNDLASFVVQQFNYFEKENIEPLIYSYRTARGMGLI
jgi:hypothetical protein